MGALGLALGICGAIAGANIIVELLFRSTVFSLFLKVIPVILHSVLPNDAIVLWFNARTARNLVPKLRRCVDLFFAHTCCFRVCIRVLGFLDIGLTEDIRHWDCLVDCLVCSPDYQLHVGGNNSVCFGIKIS
jgi:hypothetical protein